MPLGGFRYDRLPALAADLVARRVDVIFATAACAWVLEFGVSITMPKAPYDPELADLRAGGAIRVTGTIGCFARLGAEQTASGRKSVGLTSPITPIAHSDGMLGTSMWTINS